MSCKSINNLDNLKVFLTVLVIFHHVTDGLWLGAVGKFLFIGVFTTVMSFGLTGLIRMIPGVKKVI